MLRALRNLLLATVLAAPALAVEPGEALKDPALEARARALSAELRCLVCQNQSIDDSQAPLAKDLRLLVRERLTAGDSDAQVMKFLVDRYGDFILLKPPLRTGTLLLWGAPVLVLGLGVLALALKARRRVAADGAALTAQERGELDRLLKQ
jgi:cytochrome c-type biogenesis protein CcmH